MRNYAEGWKGPHVNVDSREMSHLTSTPTSGTSLDDGSYGGNRESSYPALLHDGSPNNRTREYGSMPSSRQIQLGTARSPQATTQFDASPPFHQETEHPRLSDAYTSYPRVLASMQLGSLSAEAQVQRRNFGLGSSPGSNTAQYAKGVTSPPSVSGLFHWTQPDIHIQNVVPLMRDQVSRMSLLSTGSSGQAVLPQSQNVHRRSVDHNAYTSYGYVTGDGTRRGSPWPGPGGIPIMPRVGDPVSQAFEDRQFQGLNKDDNGVPARSPPFVLSPDVMSALPGNDVDLNCLQCMQENTMVPWSVYSQQGNYDQASNIFACTRHRFSGPQDSTSEESSIDPVATFGSSERAATSESSIQEIEDTMETSQVSQKTVTTLGDVRTGPSQDDEYLVDTQGQTPPIHS